MLASSLIGPLANQASAAHSETTPATVDVNRLPERSADVALLPVFAGGAAFTTGGGGLTVTQIVGAAATALATSGLLLNTAGSRQIVGNMLNALATTLSWTTDQTLEAKAVVSRALTGLQGSAARDAGRLRHALLNALDGLLQQFTRARAASPTAPARLDQELRSAQARLSQLNLTMKAHASQATSLMNAAEKVIFGGKPITADAARALRSMRQQAAGLRKMIASAYEPLRAAGLYQNPHHPVERQLTSWLATFDRKLAWLRTRASSAPAIAARANTGAVGAAPTASPRATAALRAEVTQAVAALGSWQQTVQQLASLPPDASQAQRQAAETALLHAGQRVMAHLGAPDITKLSAKQFRQSTAGGASIAPPPPGGKGPNDNQLYARLLGAAVNAAASAGSDVLQGMLGAPVSQEKMLLGALIAGSIGLAVPVTTSGLVEASLINGGAGAAETAVRQSAGLDPADPSAIAGSFFFTSAFTGALGLLAKRALKPAPRPRVAPVPETPAEVLISVMRHRVRDLPVVVGDGFPEDGAKFLDFLAARHYNSIASMRREVTAFLGVVTDPLDANFINLEKQQLHRALAFAREALDEVMLRASAEGSVPTKAQLDKVAKKLLKQPVWERGNRPLPAATDPEYGYLQRLEAHYMPSGPELQDVVTRRLARNLKATAAAKLPSINENDALWVGFRMDQFEGYNGAIDGRDALRLLENELSTKGYRLVVQSHSMEGRIKPGDKVLLAIYKHGPQANDAASASIRNRAAQQTPQFNYSEQARWGEEHLSPMHWEKIFLQISHSAQFETRVLTPHPPTPR